MAAETMTLTDWLLAQIEADERVALDLIAEGPWNDFHRGDLRGPIRDDEYSGLNIGAGHVLAVCAAHRNIVTRARQAVRLSDDTPDDDSPASERIHGVATGLLMAVELLATAYADRPGFREEWRG